MSELGPPTPEPVSDPWDIWDPWPADPDPFNPTLGLGVSEETLSQVERSIEQPDSVFDAHMDIQGISHGLIEDLSLLHQMPHAAPLGEQLDAVEVSIEDTTEPPTFVSESPLDLQEPLDGAPLAIGPVFPGPPVPEVESSRGRPAHEGLLPPHLSRPHIGSRTGTSWSSGSSEDDDDELWWCSLQHVMVPQEECAACEYGEDPDGDGHYYCTYDYDDEKAQE